MSQDAYAVDSDGPQLESASPAVLEGLLQELRDALFKAGIPVDTWLHPGVSESTVRAELSTVDLVAPDELVVWYGFANGFSRDPAVARLSPLVFPRLSPASVQEAVSFYRLLTAKGAPYGSEDTQAAQDSDFGAGPGWLPLTTNIRGLVIECTEGSTRTPRLRWTTDEFWVDESNRHYRAVSLCTFVAWTIEGLKADAYSWNLETHSWSFKVDHLPLLQREWYFF